MSAWLLVLLLAHGADATSTALALHRGAREVNPALPQSVAGNVTMQAGLTAAELVVLHDVARQHPTAAQRLVRVAIGVEAGAVGANVRVLVTLGGRP